MNALDAPRRAVERAIQGGAHSADAVLVEGDATEARVRGEEIDFVKQARDRTLGIRVFVAGEGGLQQAVTSTSDLGADAIDRLADDSVALARATAPDPDAGLPAGGYASELPDLELVHEPDRSTAVEDRIADARRCESAARAVDARIVNSEGSDVSSEFGSIAYVSSAGFEGHYESAGHALVAQPIASENGAMQTDYWMTVSRRLDGLDAPDAVGRIAAEAALGQLGARPVPTCEVPVIFDARSARGLLQNLAGCISGSAIYRQSSFLAGRIGETIANERITVIDDGRLPGGLGSKPFDGEGQPTRRKVLVERGRLQSYLLDTYSARKLGLETTGNASRSAGSGPGVGPTNLWLEPGERSLAEIIARTDRGLLVTGLFGHGFNAVTGDFSRGARGYWIEGGERTHAVEEITIAGNLGDMLRDIDEVGSELLWLGSVAAPPLRIARMTVAGESS